MALIVNVGIEGYKPWCGAVSTWEDIEEANKVDEKEINDISEVEDIKDRYLLWYPITFDEFSFEVED